MARDFELEDQQRPNQTEQGRKEQHKLWMVDLKEAISNMPKECPEISFLGLYPRSVPHDTDNPQAMVSNLGQFLEELEAFSRLSDAEIAMANMRAIPFSWIAAPGNRRRTPAEVQYLLRYGYF
jgi:hypothetical protein